MAHRNARRADLAKLHNKDRGGHYRPWQKHNDKHKRTGEIISKNADSFARKIPAPRINKAAIAVESVTQIFIIINILTVEVENKHGFLAERIYPENGICDKKYQRRDNKSEEIGSLAVYKRPYVGFQRNGHFIFLKVQTDPSFPIRIYNHTPLLYIIFFHFTSSFKNFIRYPFVALK